MNAVIPAATARPLMASMLAKTLATAGYAATAAMVETGVGRNARWARSR
jgi:hypothetical protein